MKFRYFTGSKRNSSSNGDDDSNKRKKIKHEWNEMMTVESNESVIEWINQNHLKYFSSTTANSGDTDWYRCGLIKRSNHSECPVKAKVVKLNTTKDFTIWYTTWNHHHPDKNALKMPVKYKDEIVRQTESKVKPNMILKSLRERFDDEFPVNIRQIRYEKKKSSSSEPIINYGDLFQWVKSNKKRPTDIDHPFCLSFSHNQTTGGFNAVFSTIRCLSFAENPIWCADTTHKMMWQNFPLNIAGVFDAAGKFHKLAMSISSNETSSDWGFIFSAIAIAGKKYHQFNVRPTHIMTDAALAIKNGFVATFPYLEGTDFDLMCFFHLKKALNNAKYHTKENKIAIIKDIDVLQQCETKEVFKHVIELFIHKWIEREPDFIEYFKAEWINKNPNWFSAANLKAPNTNNAMEGFNSTLKRDFTLRERQPLTEFKSTFIEMIKSKSQMYGREIDQKVFNNKPIVTKSDWRTGAIFAQQPDVRERVIPASPVSSLVHIISQKEIDDPKINIENEKDIVKFKEQLLLVGDFDIYVENMHQRIYDVFFADDWLDSTCTCPKYMRSLMCKHIVGIAFFAKEVECPADCNPNILHKKKNRGRPAKAKSALVR